MSDVKPPAWRRVASYGGALVLGAVLLVGAWGKTLDPVSFAEQISSEGLDFLLPAQAVVFVALALEIGLGLLLVAGVRRKEVLVPAAGLVLFFLFLTGRTYVRTLMGIEVETSGCGCFGNLVDRTPAQAFWQDLVLLVPPLTLAFLAIGPKAMPLKRYATVALLTAAGLLFAWRAPELPLDDLATRLKPGVALDDICTGKGDERICLLTLVPELESGEHLVVLADLDAALGSEIDHLNGHVFAGESLFVVSAATLEENHAFFWQYGPSFEIREAPEGLLAPLYRTLPRSFLTRDGHVAETYSGLPPLSPEPTADPATDATGAAGAGAG